MLSQHPRRGEDQADPARHQTDAKRWLDSGRGWYHTHPVEFSLPNRCRLYQIACRCERPLTPRTTQKIAGACQVEDEQVVEVRDIETIYQVPLLLEEQGLRDLLSQGLRLSDLTLSQALQTKGADLWTTWKKTVATKPNLERVNIALVGKYTALPDSTNL
jgi:CTP synthase (UTP-ammonia lyase)